jgi:hypothetical protein
MLLSVGCEICEVNLNEARSKAADGQGEVVLVILTPKPENIPLKLPFFARLQVP